MKIPSLLISVAALVSLVGCKTETKQWISGDAPAGLIRSMIKDPKVPVKSIECPEQIEVEEGAEWSCTVTYEDGNHFDFSCAMQSVDTRYFECQAPSA